MPAERARVQDQDARSRRRLGVVHDERRDRERRATRSMPGFREYEGELPRRRPLDPRVSVPPPPHAPPPPAPPPRRGAPPPPAPPPGAGGEPYSSATFIPPVNPILRSTTRIFLWSRKN